MEKGKTLAAAAAKTDMDEKTARKYVKAGTLPNQIKTYQNWRIRTDPFEQVWPQLRSHLKINPELEAKSLFEDLQRRHQGYFPDGQLRPLQRKIKRWRTLEGSPREVLFLQQHHPGRLCQSDFTDMRSLGIMKDRQRFDHLLYHFMLTWSNWEPGFRKPVLQLVKTFF